MFSIHVYPEDRISLFTGESEINLGIFLSLGERHKRTKELFIKNFTLSYLS